MAASRWGAALLPLIAGMLVLLGSRDARTELAGAAKYK
jgi:hypothetical protein